MLHLYGMDGRMIPQLLLPMVWCHVCPVMLSQVPARRGNGDQTEANAASWAPLCTFLAVLA